MKNRIAAQIGILICAVMLCGGCQQTPQEVRERMEDYGDNDQMTSDSVQYWTIQELREADVKDLDVTLDNMVLPEKVDFSQVEEVSRLELSFESSFADDKDGIAGLFGIDSKALVEQPKKHEGRTFQYDTGGSYFAICDTGFISYFSGLDIAYIKEKAAYKGMLEQYELDVEDVSGKGIDFGNGKKAELSELCKKAEKWLNDTVPLNGCKGHVVDAYVKEMKAKKGIRRQLSLGVDLSYKGIRFNNYASGGISFDPEEYGIFMDYDGPDELCGFSNGTGLLKVDSAEPVEKIVDFESAVKLVNEKVSGFNEKDITKILPLYVLHPEYNGEKKVYPAQGQKVTARPAYAFLFKTEDDEAEFGINKSNVYDVVLVDMETGDLTVYIGGGND